MPGECEPSGTIEFNKRAKKDDNDATHTHTSQNPRLSYSLFLCASITADTPLSHRLQPNPCGVESLRRYGIPGSCVSRLPADMPAAKHVRIAQQRARGRVRLRAHREGPRHRQGDRADRAGDSRNSCLS